MGEAPTVYVPADDDEAAEQLDAAMPPGINTTGYTVLEHLRSAGYRICRAEP